jgi:outer membrane receptor protein involved in Fe transport
MALTLHQWRLAALASTGLTALTLGAGIAQAQDQAPAPVAAPETPAPATAPISDRDIIVTGSRVKRDGYDAPTPLTVVSQDAINKAAPANLADYVNQMPQLSPSQTSRVGNGNTSTGVNGLNLLDLRGLGPNRTLVLVDNQRVAPSTQTGAVDVNNIPTALIKRVDIVTGGASAAYGSDAVAGVVNFIIDRTFTGIKANVNGSSTSRGDNKGYDASIALGKSFAGGKGHMLFSFEHEHQDGVDFLDAKSRNWYRATYLVPNPTYKAGNGQPRQIVATNVNYNNVSQGGVITTTALKGTNFGAGGATSPFQYGTIAGNFMLGGNTWNEGNAIALSPRIDRNNAWGRLSYELSDSISASFEGSFGSSSAVNSAAYQRYAGNLTMSANNAFLPAAIRQQAAAAGVNSFGYGYSTYDLGRPVSDITRKNYRAVASLEGKLGGGWTWNAYYQYGHTDLNISLLNTTNVANFANAIDAVSSGGQTVCRSTLTNPSNGCVPLNIFGYGVASSAAIGYVKGTAWQKQGITEQVTAASISGEPIHSWAGPVSLAAGIEHRSESANAVGDPLSQTNGWYTGNYKTNSGGYNVTEGFAETVVPLLRSDKLGKSDFNGAVRVTSYSTSGMVTTWKAGLTYEPIPDIKLRAVVSRDIRAPSISELYIAGATQATDVADPVKGVTVRTTAVSNGNTNLRPEKADTLSLGAVFRPRFLPGFSASVDYYNIRLKDAITTLAVADIVNRCAAGEAAICNYVTRDSGGNITSILRIPVNLATLRVRGLDFDASYRMDAAKIIPGLQGSFSLHFLATRALNYAYTNAGNTTEFVGENGGPNATYPIPKLRTYTTLGYDGEKGSFQATMRGVSSGVYDNTWKSGVDIDNNTIAGATYFDLAGSYNVWGSGPRKAELYFKVENLMDKDPPVAAGIASSTLQTNPVLYDTLGRNFRVGVRVRY